MQKSFDRFGQMKMCVVFFFAFLHFYNMEYRKLRFFSEKLGFCVEPLCLVLNLEDGEIKAEFFFKGKKKKKRICWKLPSTASLA